VAVVDFDVHHGNGTEDIFANDPRVLMVSTFQHPFYPYSGTKIRPRTWSTCRCRPARAATAFASGGGRCLAAGAAPLRLKRSFISAGFDAHYEDDMASLGLVEADYAWVTQQLKAVAAESAQGRIVSMLEGGYALSALARSVTTHIKALADL
jgi:acetoin utilization deacetylase AcuC-like enzyme